MPFLYRRKAQNIFPQLHLLLESNIFLKKLITTDKDKVKIITNHIFKTSETLEDNDNVSEFIEANPLDM